MKEQFIIKLPFNNSFKSHTSIKMKLDMNHIYVFDSETHKSIMGIPHENDIPVMINNNVLSIGKQDVVLSEEFVSHLLDKAFNKEVHLGIKPDFISEEEQPNSIQIKAKLEFIEQKTDYQAVYFSLEGLEGYFAMKVRNEEEVKLGKEVTLYLPLNRINIYNDEHDKLNSREVVYPNLTKAVIKNVKGNMHINIAGKTLVYPAEEGLEDGEYEVKLHQDKLMPIFPRKMVKKGLKNPEMDNPNNKIKVSAYDEDVLGKTLLTYVAVEGFENYVSLVLENNFSVYKLPKFEVYVPREALEIITKDAAEVSK